MFPLRTLLNLFLMTLGGILGNLVAAMIQQSLWGNDFTVGRVVGTILGLALVLFLLILLDTKSQEKDNRAARSGHTNASTNGTIAGNIQIGSTLIRVFRGTNVYGNIQIGSSRIEHIDDASDPAKQSSPQKSKR